MPGLEKNRIYRAHIDGYSSEGLGIARIDGQVVFVHGAVRGETCDVLVMKVLKNAAFGKIAALAEPSPARRQPDCPYYGRCGGCDFRHMSYEEELWAKRARVQDALTRIGGAEVTVEEILGAEQPLHYRNKSIYPISPVGEVGFYRARSHQVVHVEHCLIQKPEADALLRRCGTILPGFRCRPTTRPPTGGCCGICTSAPAAPGNPWRACWSTAPVCTMRRSWWPCSGPPRQKPAAWCWGKIPAGETPSWGTGSAPCGAGTI